MGIKKRKDNQMKNKPVKISKEEYYEIYDALARKAMELCNENPCLYFSCASMTAYYNDLYTLPKSFRAVQKRETGSLFHFLPVSCESKEANMNSKVMVICLAVVDYPGKGLKGREYYLDTHRIGRCHWKVEFSL